MTETGTVLLRFAVIDADPFLFVPGQFVAIDCEHPDLGYRRSPYCLYSASTGDRTFELLVRVVRQGPVSLFLGSLDPGEVIGFRGPSGHSMIPKEEGTHLVLVATGVGFGPCHCLLNHLVEARSERKVSLYWGLRQEADVCLLDELIRFERELESFDWHISMSAPSGEWPPLQGRVTHTVPGRLTSLADKQFFLVSNGAMVATFSAALREVGVAGSRIYEESFFDHRYRPGRQEIEDVVARFEATDLMTPLLDVKSSWGRNE